MTPDLQREVLSTVAEILELAPSLRIGQLMAHLGFLGDAHLGKGLSDLDDDELLAILYRHRSELEARFQGKPESTVPPVGSETSISGSPTFPQVGPPAID